MSLHVNLLEAVWVALNLSALILTLSALVDALADRTAIRLLNGHAREVAAAGIVRRESFRVVIQTLLLVAIIPPALTPGEPVLSLSVVALMAVPVVLLTSSALDARERKLATIMVAADILAENVSAMARLEAAVAENTAITVTAGQHADDAYSTAAAVETTVGHTAEQVDEIHDATVGK